MAIKTPTPLAQARRLAEEKILPALRPFCQRIEIAGSIRRCKPEVGDIDLVALPSDREALIERFTRGKNVIEQGAMNITIRLANQLEIGLYLARGEVRDLFEPAVPGNYGSLLLCRTGSRFFNMKIADRARDLNLHWNPYKGITKHGRVIAAAEEADIFQALQMDFIPPENRK